MIFALFYLIWRERVQARLLGRGGYGYTTAHDVNFYKIRILNTILFSFNSSVSANNCGSSDYFYCTNNRCIKTSLTCDSIDNCGDGSDETMDSPEDICHGTSNFVT